MSNEQPQIILLHGLGRLPASMGRLAKAFKGAGYRVFNPGYNGIFGDYKGILKSLDQRINEWMDADKTVHFVGHSFGGILIRGLLASNPQWETGRCVMLGTPNKGTETASYMTSHWLFKYLVPNVTDDLIPDSELLQSLPEPKIETGIIAGNVAYSFIIPVSWFYNKATENAPGDGVVEIENTRLNSDIDFKLMPLHHSFMTRNKQLIEQVLHFIEKGEFDKNV